MASARRQVLIEATVAEVQLNNQYQRGIDWAKLRNGGTGFQFVQSSANTPAGVTTNAFTVGYALASSNFTSAIRLLESFGTVHVLSSPTISVLNNQTAILKVVDNQVYFTIQASTSAGPNGATPITTYPTTPNIVAVGLIMSVTPEIGDADSVLLNVRPSISRIVGNVPDPNPTLASPCSGCAPIVSNIPVIETREMESLIKVNSGQIAVMGGLIQDNVSNLQDSVPGASRLAGYGGVFGNKKQTKSKNQLGVFMRPIVIHDASIDGD